MPKLIPSNAACFEISKISDGTNRWYYQDVTHTVDQYDPPVNTDSQEKLATDIQEKEGSTSSTSPAQHGQDESGSKHADEQSVHPSSQASQSGEDARSPSPVDEKAQQSKKVLVRTHFEHVQDQDHLLKFRHTFFDREQNAFLEPEDGCAPLPLPELIQASQHVTSGHLGVDFTQIAPEL
jgi:hypothetical protein